MAAVERNLGGSHHPLRCDSLASQNRPVLLGKPPNRLLRFTITTSNHARTLPYCRSAATELGALARSRSERLRRLRVAGTAPHRMRRRGAFRHSYRFASEVIGRNRHQVNRGYHEPRRFDPRSSPVSIATRRDTLDGLFGVLMLIQIGDGDIGAFGQRQSQRRGQWRCSHR